MHGNNFRKTEIKKKNVKYFQKIHFRNWFFIPLKGSFFFTKLHKIFLNFFLNFTTSIIRAFCSRNYAQCLSLNELLLYTFSFQFHTLNLFNVTDEEWIMFFKLNHDCFKFKCWRISCFLFIRMRRWIFSWKTYTFIF